MKHNVDRKSKDNILDVQGLSVVYDIGDSLINAVTGVSFSVGKSEKVGLVGESGSGKSTTILAILKLINLPGRITGGSISLLGEDVSRFSESDFRKIRFKDISFIPQGAMNALNPVMKIGEQIGDLFRPHGFLINNHEKSQRINEALNSVKLEGTVANLYPHELSGGMKQRVCIAMATILSPKLIIADEPTSALDVVVQMQVFETLEELRRKIGAAILIVGHDMGIMAQFTDKIGVMYAGELVEFNDTAGIFDSPLHPYTARLIKSLPSIDKRGDLVGIPGVPPSLSEPIVGCSFAERCSVKLDLCDSLKPDYVSNDSGHHVACHLVSNGFNKP